VLVERSDLHIQARQLSVDLKPISASAKLRWDATYMLLDTREQYFGFVSTAGDPFAIERGQPLQTRRHTLTMRWSDFPIHDIVYLTAVVQASSGLPYTPMIATDVNGDGANNDRAFIPNPATTTDTSLGRAMKSLLSSGTAAARDCLIRQFDRLATRGSCRGPWTITNALQIKFNPQKIGVPKRATVALTILNPLGLADLAINGADGVRGWGQRVPPDQNLLFVRGFDAASRQFKYDVNQTFGSTRPRQWMARTLPYLSLTVSLDLGVPRERQVLTQRLDVGRGQPGTRADMESMKNLGTSSIPNSMAMLLTQQTALQLTRAQADTLANLSRAFSVFTDSVWTPVAAYLTTLPDDYRSGEAYARYVSARERTVDYLLTLVPRANEVLTASQRRKLPIQISTYLDRRVLEFLRSSSSGDGSSLAR
jgi:hypothetical protein